MASAAKAASDSRRPAVPNWAPISTAIEQLLGVPPAVAIFEPFRTSNGDKKCVEANPIRDQQSFACYVGSATHPCEILFSCRKRPDDLGVELPSIADAKCEAARYAGKLLSDASDTFWKTAETAMTVTNEAGLASFVLNISGSDAPSILVVPKVST